MKVQQKSSLADKIAGILNTAPASFDPEDDVVDSTNAQIAQEDVDDTQEEEEILSKFRRANIDLLADLDEKYAGKKTTRKALKDLDSDESAESIGEDGASESEHSDPDDGSNLESEDMSSDAEGSGTGDDSADSEEDDADMEGDYLEDNEDDTFKHISDTNVSNQISKGVCVRNQMSMWENLLEIRIQLQKCLLTANKMPQKSTFLEIKKECGSEFTNKVNETKTKLTSTLDKLLLLQKLLLKQYPETKNLGSETRNSDKSESADDEEIPSDTESEKSAEEEEHTEEPKRKKMKLENYEQELLRQHKNYKDYRDGIIQKWNDKTRVVLKGGATSHSVLDQIQYNLSNKDRLIKRTQLKRSQYSILGKDTNVDEAKEEGVEEYNTEIYDDDDFYHQLLRELIEVKSADVTDPVQLGRQWIQLQNLRSKMKRKIDTRATKGRKIRYAVHSKLVNFMAPIDEYSWTDEAKNELYNSLFGKNQPVLNM